MTRTATLTLNAYASPYLRSDTPPEQLAGLLCYTTADMTANGYTLVGRAQVTVELFDEFDPIDHQAARLRRQIEMTRRQSDETIRSLEDMLQSLQTTIPEPA